jgi:hypothetical protein
VERAEGHRSTGLEEAGRCGTIASDGGSHGLSLSLYPHIAAGGGGDGLGLAEESEGGAVRPGGRGQLFYVRNLQKTPAFLRIQAA